MFGWGCVCVCVCVCVCFISINKQMRNSDFRALLLEEGAKANAHYFLFFFFPKYLFIWPQRVLVAVHGDT